MRQPDCAYYLACLSEHAHCDDNFDCPCPRYEREISNLSVNEIAACGALLLALYRPIEYEALRRNPTFRDSVLTAILAVSVARRRSTLQPISSYKRVLKKCV